MKRCLMWEALIDPRQAAVSVDASYEKAMSIFPSATWSIPSTSYLLALSCGLLRS